MIKATFTACETNLVIVGSNSGIAQALVKQMQGSGAQVTGIDIQDKNFNSSQDGFSYIKVNPLEYSELVKVAESIQEKMTHIDGLVNLSGTLTHFKPIEDMLAEEWKQTYDISFKSCYNSCKVFMELLKKAPSTSIVNMSSGLAFGGQKNYGPYSTAKAAVVSFSRTLATELAPSVRVNSIAPGAVDTNFIYNEDGATRFDMDAYTSIVPLGAIAKPEEIASVILFLLSDGAAHITGQCLHVNGGAMMV